jgi:bleomycin hydrolase
MNKIFIFALLTCTASVMSAQSLSENLIQKIRSQYKPTPSEKALRNALGATDLKKLAVNQDNRQELVTVQPSSGKQAT